MRPCLSPPRRGAWAAPPCSSPRRWARPLGVASQRNRDYLRGLGAGEVFDYHAGDWVQQVLAVVPGGVDVLFDAAGGQTRDQAVGAVREGGRAIFLVGAPAQLGHGVVGESLDADVTRRVLEAIAGWSRRAGCAPRSRRYSRSSRCAKRCNGSPADTRAARSCSRLGSSCRRASRPISAN